MLQQWTYSGTKCGGNFYLYFYCIGSDWELKMSDGAFNNPQFIQDPSSGCVPFQMNYTTLFAFSSLCSGSVTAIVTY